MLNQEKLFQDQTIIIQMISTGAPLKKILTFITKNIEKDCHLHSASAAIMIYNDNTRKLEHTISPSLPHVYARSLEPIEIGPYEGSCGTAAFLKRPVIVEDIEKSPIWQKHKSKATKFGFVASTAVPILSTKKELLGTLVLFFRKVYAPSPSMMELLDFYNRLLSVAIEFSMSQANYEANSVLLSHHTESFGELDHHSDQKLLVQLYDALEKEELDLHYQPYFGVKKGNLGLEALIRWNHPTFGLLSPASFLGIAERSGFILEMEKWVLSKSLKQIKKIQNGGSRNLRLSVNISAEQFGQETFPHTIEGLLEEHSFAPEKLTLEVTERFLIQENNIAALNRIKEMGVRISIDDFGVSYSSLKYLQDLSINELKIDRSFIANMEKDSNSQKIVEMIIMLGHSLNLNIVAEGVETENQYELLKKMNCDMVQGFLFSKPMPLDNLITNILNKKIV